MIIIMITDIVVTMQHITHLSCIGKDYEIINQFSLGGGDVATNLKPQKNLFVKRSLLFVLHICNPINSFSPHPNNMMLEKSFKEHWI